MINLINQLIEIGRSEIIPSIPYSEFSYLGEDQWQRASYPDECDSYSYEELKSLYKALVQSKKIECKLVYNFIKVYINIT